MLGDGMHTTNTAHWSSFVAGQPIMIGEVPQLTHNPVHWADAATGSPLVQWANATTGAPVIQRTCAAYRPVVGCLPDAAMVAGPPLIRRHTPKTHKNTSSLNTLCYNVTDRSIVSPKPATSIHTVPCQVSTATGVPLIQGTQDRLSAATDRSSLQVALSACGSSVQIASMSTDGSSLTATAVASDGSVMRAASFVSDGSSMHAMSVISNGLALHATSVSSDKACLHAAAISSDQSSLHATSVSCDRSSMRSTTFKSVGLPQCAAKISADTSPQYVMARKSNDISTYNDH